MQLSLGTWLHVPRPAPLLAHGAWPESAAAGMPRYMTAECCPRVIDVVLTHEAWSGIGGFEGMPGIKATPGPGCVGGSQLQTAECGTVLVISDGVRVLLQGLTSVLSPPCVRACVWAYILPREPRRPPPHPSRRHTAAWDPGPPDCDGRPAHSVRVEHRPRCRSWSRTMKPR